MNRNVSLILMILIIWLLIFNTFAQNDQKVKLVVQTGSDNDITAIAFSPDSQFVITGDYSGSVVIWDIFGRQLLRLNEDNEIKDVAISSNNQVVATLLSGNEIVVRHLLDSSESKRIRHDSYRFESISISPLGDMLLLKVNNSQTNKQSCLLWNIKQNKVIHEFTGAYSATFSNDGKNFLLLTTIKLSETTSVEALQLYKIADFKVEWQSEPIKHFYDGSRLNFSFEDKQIVLSRSRGNCCFALFDAKTGSRTSTNENEKKCLSSGSSELAKVIEIIKDDDLALAISPNQELLVADTNFKGGSDGRFNNSLSLFDLATGKKLTGLERKARITQLLRTTNAKRNQTLIVDISGNAYLWDLFEGREVQRFLFTKESLDTGQGGLPVAAISSNGRVVLIHPYDSQKVFVWNAESGTLLQEISPATVISLEITNNGDKVLISDCKSLYLMNTFTSTVYWEHIYNPQGCNSNFEQRSKRRNTILSFDNKTVLLGDRGLFDFETGKLQKGFLKFGGFPAAMSPDKQYSAIRGYDNNAVLLKNSTETLVKSFGDSYAFEFSINSRHLIIAIGKDLVIAKSNTGEEVRRIQIADGKINDVRFSPDGKFVLTAISDGSTRFFRFDDGGEVCQVFSFDNKSWLVIRPDGRFDTNNIEGILGLLWTVNSEPLKPLPLNVFMRQYYEPNLLQRVLKCNEENNCDKEFKPLPSIAEINRVQPKVLIKDVRKVKDSADLVDVTVEVESVTEDVSVSVLDRAKKEKKTSGVFDLRLFRDEQLVGVSAPQGKLEKFIKDAPRLVEETRKSGKLIDTPEDRAWREANDVFALTGENVRKISANKIEYVFRNVRLPKDGRESVEFKAYAFNADKVKSQTTEPLKFSIPKTISAEKKKGKAILVSIGVNASENPAYDLRYAANDARKMQEIIGSRLKADNEQYAEVVQIPLVSDHDADGNLSENAAQKAVIKGVFSLLEGRTMKDVSAEISKENPQLADVLKNIPNIEKIKAVEPEDTLIITYAGHGYADQSGIFYLLPYDIGKDTRQLTTEALRKTISSDELSLWMQEITAAEMIFIIDACHSSAAVQGDGFKPGPMGSRGLGQLAYDKDMKILSATQANNVALELGSLQQGLLSYALLEDGIVRSFADADKDKKLLSTEWLNYAEKRVPELYSEVKDGKRGVIIDGKNVKSVTKRSDIEYLDGSNQKSSLNLQQPSLFDFKRRNVENTLLVLP